MCCIIHRPRDAEHITQSYLEKIIKINSDGWGISYFQNGMLKVIKSLDMAEAIADIRHAEKENLEFLFHARFTTHGQTIVENCHPYNLNNGVLFHNGKIDVYCRDKKFSDTYFFSLKVNKFLKKKHSINSIVSRFKSVIGNSRLAFMSDTGEILKFGDWHNVEGCFYSKLNWKSQYDNYAYAGYGWQPNSYESNLWGNAYSNKQDNYFSEVLERAKENKIIHSYLVKSLTDKQLNTIARDYPALCAEVLSRICK